MLGKEVATLVNGEKEAGSYSATLNGSKLSSGIYFLHITVRQFYRNKKTYVDEVRLGVRGKKNPVPIISAAGFFYIQTHPLPLSLSQQSNAQRGNFLVTALSTLRPT